MPNEKVQLKKGLSTNLPSTYTPGDILFETDTGNMYVDVTSTENSSQRVQVKDDTKLPLAGGTLSGHLILSNNSMQLYGSGTNLVLTNTNSSGALYLRGTTVTILSSDSSNVLQLSKSGVNVFNRKLLKVATPTQSSDAANKQYVDGLYQNLESEIVTTASQYLPLKGGTMTGSIDIGNYLITSLGTPQSDTDAANKQYVDTKMDKWGDIQDLGGGGAPLIIKPQDQSDLGTPTTRFGISLTGYPNDGLYLTSTGHSIYCENYELSVSNSGVSFVENGETQTYLTLSSSGTSLNSMLSIDGTVHCKDDIYLEQSDPWSSIRFTLVSSGVLGISSYSEGEGPVVIRGVSTPVDSTDAANKSYVDAAISNVDVEWSNVSSKPFTSIGTGLQVSSNVLSVDTSDLVIDDGSLS